MSERLHAFAGYGIELEYMIVDRDTLDVLPIADALLGEKGTLEHGDFAWSNEIVQHVVELKNRRPEPGLAALAAGFKREVDALNTRLAPRGARLMPTGMHPWMNAGAMHLWPHDTARIYTTYHRVFDCAQHGQANLQSVQVNLPFHDDDEFARLHAATRLLLPILPALAASSPIVDGVPTGLLDTRMKVYADAARRVPSVIGALVPDTVTSRSAYEATILAPMYRDIAALDPDDVLPHEWLNARGAIPRFDRHALEVRVIDAQECPQADFAIAAATVAVVRAFYDETLAPLALQQAMPTGALAALLTDCVRDGETTRITDADYLALFGYPKRSCRADELWRHLIDTLVPRDPVWDATLGLILERGPLARRILRALRPDPSRVRLHEVYRHLCDCLEAGRLFAA